MRMSSFPLIVACLLSACASVPPATSPADSLFADRLFGPPSESVTTSDVFTPSEAMKRYLDVDIGRQLRAKGVQRGLIEALYQKSQLKLEYDAAKTKTAAEAFATRSGNCLSLVIMTAALAKRLNLPVTYQSAYREETWSRDGNLLLASGHLNISLGQHMTDSAATHDLSLTTIDFLPPEDIRSMRTRAVGEATVIAMFANNRAAEAMAQGRIDDAYAWAREALRKDPSFLSGYNTLGVVYMRHGDLGEAARVFERVLESEPRHTQSLANLAETYARQGRGAEAGAVRARLAAIEADPPFAFFYLGLDAMRQGNWLTARDLFAREVARADYDDEFHFWLGVADWRLGDLAQARKHLKLAMDNSTTRGQHDLYAAKLAWLQAHAQQ